MLFEMSRTEVEHVALCFNLRAIGAVPIPMNGPDLPAPAFRLRFIRSMLQEPPPASFVFDFDSADLWLLDTLLTDSDPRGTKLPDGQPALGLVKRIWAAMIAAEEGGYARNDDDDENQHAGAHGDEALHRAG